MESGVAQECAETQSILTTPSTEGFQKSMFELFEKNGILNDLRAYLRGHLVEILKSAQTGDQPACQKHFTQRLEPVMQALNILIAEYLLRFEFNYSLSVFISEIPLANMVFGFAKTLMKDNTDEHGDLRFKDADVWSILNCLGIPCDSEHAANIVEMYKNARNSPLLQCIMKCKPLYQSQHFGIDQVISSEESISTRESSAETLNHRKRQGSHRNIPLSEKCKHYAFCKTCQNRIIRLKEKYIKKKKALSKTYKDKESINPQNVESLLKNIGVIERILIDEMFYHLKSVYESEVQVIKAEEENKVKHSMASHTLQLQQKYAEMEESFKARELALERNVKQKKQFLWGLARALREQHDTLTRAMRDVRSETDRLTAKEKSLKCQLAEAELILRKRGEEMRSQISHELAILEGHLDSMKRERDSITRERSQLQSLKMQDSANAVKIHNTEKEDIHSHYVLVQNELAILRKYIESLHLAPKCVIERGTTTDFIVSDAFKNILNNSQNGERFRNEDLDDRLKMNQVINDFRKKNVNFCQRNVDGMQQECREDQSSVSSEMVNPELDLNRNSDVIQQLRDENQRLKTLATQQRLQLEQLSDAGPVWVEPRPRTAPPQPAPRYNMMHNVPTNSSTSALNVGWRKGAGEELSFFSSAEPRVLVPGDTLPFIGVLRDRHPTSRRQMVSQWRALRSRLPLAGVTKRTVSPIRDRLGSAMANASNSPRNKHQQSHAPTAQPRRNSPSRDGTRRQSPISFDIDRNREKSPKSVLREAKQKLRNMDTIKDNDTPPAREKSPNTVLREAKLRLRKLEIEAEAVETSYLNFRRRQSELRLERSGVTKNQYEPIVNNLEIRRSRSFQKLVEPNKSDNNNNSRNIDIPKALKHDFDKFLRNYNKIDIGGTHFGNKTAVQKANPIPEVFSRINDENSFQNMRMERDNFLETPLMEFRKLYQSAKEVKQGDNPIVCNTSRNIKSKRLSIGSEENIDHKNLQNFKYDKQAELEILKQNINKIYHVPDDSFPSGTTLDLPDVDPSKDSNIKDRSLLRIEVESVELHDQETENMLIVVRSSVDQQVTLAERDNPSELSNVVNLSMPSSIKEEISHRETPEQAARLTRNDVLDAIFHTRPTTPTFSGPKSIDEIDTKSPAQSEFSEQAENHSNNDILKPVFHTESINGIYSSQMIPVNDFQESKEILESHKEVLEDSISEFENEKEMREELEYADDFSADVDNYNSRSEYGNNSPISLPKTPEDENFWDP